MYLFELRRLCAESPTLRFQFGQKDKEFRFDESSTCVCRFIRRLSLSTADLGVTLNTFGALPFQLHIITYHVV